MRGIPYDDKFLILLYDKMLYFKSHYIYPSQKTLLKWLLTRGGLDVSIRTLNRYLRQLQNRQIIGRIRRLKHHPGKGMEFNTTLYGIGFLGLKRLVQIGSMTFDDFRAWLKNSAPFRARQSKKQEKGLAPTDKGFYKDARSLGGIVTECIK